MDTESRTAFATDDYRRLLNCALGAVEGCAAVVLSDYAKGAMTEEVCQSVIREARSKRIPVLVDPKSPNFARYRRASAICPNRKELAVATGLPADDLSQLLNAGQELLRELDLQFMAVTLGEKGIAVLEPGSQSHAPAVVRQVFDVSGAGNPVATASSLRFGQIALARRYRAKFEPKWLPSNWNHLLLARLLFAD